MCGFIRKMRPALDGLLQRLFWKGQAMTRRPLAPEVVQQVKDGLAAGLNPGRAAAAAGVSATFAYVLYRSMGGVCRPAGTTYCDRYLNREKRDEIARLRDAGLGVRATARLVGVAASTVSRELRRNADPKAGHYIPGRADRVAWER